MECPNCGKEYLDNSQLICEFCGTELISNQPEILKENLPKSRLEQFAEDSGLKEVYNKLKESFKKLKD